MLPQSPLPTGLPLLYMLSLLPQSLPLLLQKQYMYSKYLLPVLRLPLQQMHSHSNLKVQHKLKSQKKYASQSVSSNRVYDFFHFFFGKVSTYYDEQFSVRPSACISRVI